MALGRAGAAGAGSPWSPFRSRVFAVMWSAMLLGNIGTAMREVGAGWLMTTLTPSATLVAAVQVAGTLPIVLLALPAGTLADLVDRRTLLIATHGLLLVLCLAMGLLTDLGMMTPGLLLAGLLLAGAGTGLLVPVLQSLTPLQVPAPALREAIALNSMGFNVSRAIGPALAGVLIVSMAASLPFYVNAATYLLVIGALFWWRAAATPAAAGNAEAFGPALRGGLRYVEHSLALRRTLVRAGSFFLFASAYWALLPLIVRDRLGGDARDFGVLLGCIGLGAVSAALLLPRWRARFGTEATMRTGTVLTMLVLAAFALARHVGLAAAAAALAGMAWVAVLTSANTAAQTALPNWVRGRGLAVYLTVFYGAMTLGGLAWGLVADLAGTAAALWSAAATGLVALALAKVWPMDSAEPDLSPSLLWPEPTWAHTTPDADRPTVVSIEYRVHPDDRAHFITAMQLLAETRRRNGALEWHLLEDASRPGRMREVFRDANWAAHLRHHAHMTRTDSLVQARVNRYHRAEAPPVVEHWSRLA
jgi:MFS family permease/quinol monooxygenase YgiN